MNGAGQQNQWLATLPWLMVLGVFFVMVVMPQRKREKERQAMISTLKKGDRVLLASGFYGRVVKPGENIFSIELGKGLTVEVERNAIMSRVESANTEVAHSE